MTEEKEAPKNANISEYQKLKRDIREIDGHTTTSLKSRELVCNVLNEIVDRELLTQLTAQDNYHQIKGLKERVKSHGETLSRVVKNQDELIQHVRQLLAKNGGVNKEIRGEK